MGEAGCVGFRLGDVGLLGQAAVDLGGVFG